MVMLGVHREHSVPLCKGKQFYPLQSFYLYIYVYMYLQTQIPEFCIVTVFFPESFSEFSFVQ